ncbi:hypothetical protein H072_6651 [Dactylellina haptotyla CBS 200.50]|uniref:polynucleotide adenylyltransferase n=1 Tax=Dactylellina haptotyla (strain CBS 200.50) TaxID=1284197 RepID=S8BJQ3_DACHA|nr:hypothetical protein H072_6651 [Dactylellina haptotyla CBS 200.50]
MASTSTFPPTQTPDTALALVLPSSHLDIVQPFRSLYDAAAIKWPPHINLFYPFVHSATLGAASEFLSQNLHSICETPIRIRFSDVEVFQGGKKRPSFLVLRPDEESEKRIQEIYELLSSEFPDVRKAVKRQDFKPHLTLGQFNNASEGKIQFFSNKFEMICKDIGEVEMGLATMRRVDGKMQFQGSWGVQEYPVSLSPECVPGSVIQRTTWKFKPPYQSEYEDESEEEETEVESKWEPVEVDQAAEKKPGQNFTLSSYNVFVDVDDITKQNERWYKICKKLISTSSTIVCLQEVSDDLLIMMGNSWELRRKYPYISHSPEKPLLRARNCVILSSVPFTWEEVTSNVQKRSICVAKFQQLGYYTVQDTQNDEEVEKTWHPLIVSNVHLPAYLTDEAVKNRAEYTKEIMSYLETNYHTNPVLIVGDTNIHNEGTVEYAVAHKIISEASGAEYPKLFSSSEFSDAWLIAGEGLEGNTFDPSTNILALENAQSGSSVPIRPQRFDRVYLRKQGGDNLLIREARVAPDSDPEDPASDHYILNTKLSFVDTDKQATAAPLLDLLATSLNDSDLRDLLLENKCFPSPSDITLRHRALESLEACLKGFSDLSQTQSAESTFQLRLTPVGSFGLDTYDPASDIDYLGVGTISTSLFWRVAKQRIKKWRGKSADDSTLNPSDALSVKIVRYVDAQIPMLILLVGDSIRVDLQYCTAVKIVENWDAIPSAPMNSSLFNLTVPTLKKLQAYRDMLFILNNVPNLATFRLAYRFLKLWATKKGVYSSKFGFFGGVHITLLLARIAMLLPPSATASQLVLVFFRHYAKLDWSHEMISIPNTGRVVRYQRAARDKMVILTITTPAVNVAANATSHTLRTLSGELEHAVAKFDVDASFVEIAGTFGNSVGSLSSSVGDFLNGFNRYIKVEVQFWGTNRQGGRALVGWVESRLVGLLAELGKHTPGLTARVWPGRFHEVKPEDGDETTTAAAKEVDEDEKSELRGFYLVGLAPVSNSEMSKEDKRNGEAAFASVLRNFESAVRNKDKVDEKDSWISVSCVKQNEMTTEVGHVVREDKTMVWDGGEADEEGDTIPDEDSESDEENDMVEQLLGEGDEGDGFDDFFGPTAKKNKKKAAAVIQQKTGPTPKLRPSHEVFNRIKWDGKYDAASYVIGYEDRFRGVLEIGAHLWKTEMTDEEFVPMHRVVYFKEKKTGVVVWDREKRVDKIFGSGKSEEKKGKK